MGCTEGETLLGSAKGCITPVSLSYDAGKNVQWFVDEALLAQNSLRLGTSEEGALPGTVVDIPLGKLEQLLSASGHWSSKKTIDCTKWGVADGAEVVVSSAPVASSFASTCRSDPSTWYSPPYQTANGFVL